MNDSEFRDYAKQSGLGQLLDCDGVDGCLEHFANLVAQHERERLTDAAMKAAEKAVDVAIALEREACAELCEMLDVANPKGKSWDEGTIDCANAIRARGQT